MADHKLTAPRVRVLVETDPASPDLTEYTVQTDNRDMVRYDLMRARKNWPTQREAPILFMSAVAWHALKRSGETADDVETYLDKIVEITPVDEDGNPVGVEDAEETQSADSLA